MNLELVFSLTVLGREYGWVFCSKNVPDSLKPERETHSRYQATWATGPGHMTWTWRRPYDTGFGIAKPVLHLVPRSERTFAIPSPQALNTVSNSNYNNEIIKSPVGFNIGQGPNDPAEYFIISYCNCQPILNSYTILWRPTAIHILIYFTLPSINILNISPLLNNENPSHFHIGT